MRRWLAIGIAAAAAAVFLIGCQPDVGETGMLWTAAYWSEELVGVSAADLESGTLDGGVRRITRSDGWGPDGLAFDANGNLWVADYELSRILVFGPAALAAGGAPSPILTLTGDEIYSPIGLAFDAAGNLWVADYDLHFIAMIPNVVGLTGSVSRNATVVLSTPGTLENYYGLAFDTAGNLWAASWDSGDNDGHIARFDAATLASSATTRGDLIVPLTQAIDVAFDASGRLYATSLSAGRIYRFNAPGALTPASTPDAEIGVAGISSMRGLAFDAAGNLWASGTDGADNVFLMAISNPGTASGTVTPARKIALPLDIKIDSGALAFWPIPTDVPINAP